MTPEQLKASILQYAIQGKLVDQRPEEGTAEELYKQIQEEKEKLIKEGKIKKEKPLDAIAEDDIPFDIPENWKWVKLGDLVSVLGGKRIPAGRKLTKENTGYIYVRVSDMKNATVLTDDLQYVPEDIYPSISKYIINKEDVYITVAGTIGRIGKIPAEIDGANLTENADRLVFNMLDQDWLIKTLSSSLIQNQIADATTKVGQPKLAIKRIQELLIPLPPIAEQHRIVAKIEELLPFVDRYAEAYEKLEKFNAKFPEDMKKSILQYAIMGKLVEQRAEEGSAEDLYKQIQEEKSKLIKEGKIKKEKPLEDIADDEIPFDIPESWKWVKLGTLFAIERGSSPRPIKDYLTQDADGVNWIKIGDSEVGAKYITSTLEKITPKGAEKSRKVEIGDFIISNSMSFGRPYIMAIEGYVHDGWNIIHFISDEDGKDLLYKDYIYYILSSNLLRQQIISKAAGGVVQNIRSDNLKELMVPVPPLEEQKRIVTKIEELLPYCDALIK